MAMNFPADKQTNVPTDAPWRWLDGDLVINILVSPRSSKNAVGAIHDARIKVFVTAAPEDGAANHAVVALFAKLAKVSKSNVQLLAGLSSRRKQLRICGVTEANATQWLPSSQ